MLALPPANFGYRTSRGLSNVEHLRALRWYLFIRDRGQCQLCFGPINLSAVCADHVIPQSRGGSHDAANLQAAHRKCNSRKNNRDLMPVASGRPSYYVRHTKPVEPEFVKPDVLGVDEFARRVGVDPETVRRWLRAKKITANQISPPTGRYFIPASELRKVIGTT